MILEDDLTKLSINRLNKSIHGYLDHFNVHDVLSGVIAGSLVASHFVCPFVATAMEC